MNKIGMMDDQMLFNVARECTVPQNFKLRPMR